MPNAPAAPGGARQRPPPVTQLDPAMQHMVDTLHQLVPQVGTEVVDATELRDRFADLARRFATDSPLAVGRVEDMTIETAGPAARRLQVRVYWPTNAAPHLPAIVFFHGGGWVVGDLDSHDATCRLLCQEVDALVVSVDYRLSPEHPYPAAVEDAHAAACWVHERAADLGADPARIAVAGESSGGNLAAVTCLVARDRSGPRLKAQLLLFPVTNFAFDTASYTASAEGYVLTRAAMEWYWAQYLADPRDGRAPYASPLLAASMEGLPAAIIVSAEWDPLRDEGEAYGQRLMAEGVPAEILRYNGVIHGFTSMTSLAVTKQAIKTIYGNLRALLAE